jgi:hypothetical protein
LKNFEKKNSSTLGQLSRSRLKGIEAKIRDSVSAHVIPYWGKFFYLQEARKINFMFHTGANFSIFTKLEKLILHTGAKNFPFLGGKLEKFEESST